MLGNDVVGEPTITYNIYIDLVKGEYVKNSHFQVIQSVCCYIITQAIVFEQPPQIVNYEELNSYQTANDI